MNKNSAILNIFISIMVLTVIVGFDIKHTPKVEAQTPVVLPTPTPTATPRPSEGPVIDYVREVFGEYSDKALLLLRGDGSGSCAENRTLDPNAVNDNTTWGGVGRDCGIFQINDVYHPFTCTQLKDWRLNIDYAWRMFVNDDYQFVRWTCGRHYGI